MLRKIFFVGLFLPFSCLAHYLTFNKLQENWDSNDRAKKAFVYGYVVAVLNDLSDQTPICITNNEWNIFVGKVMVQASQYDAKLNAFTGDNPEKSKFPANSPIEMAIKHLYACKK